MTSERKFAANRINASRSTGPKTAEGKVRASRNALRHGLATITRHNHSVSAQIERIARAICGDDAPPAQYEQALIIAESEVVLLHVRTARVAAIERARKIVPCSRALVPGFPTEQEWEYAFDDLALGRPQKVTKLLARGADAVRAFSAMSAHAGDDEHKAEQLGQDQRQSTLQDDNDARPPASENPSATMARSKLEAFCQALPDLVSLDRYARRAVSRRRRAIRKFIANSIVHSLPAGPP
jgi:hypothetical protein